MRRGHASDAHEEGEGAIDTNSNTWIVVSIGAVWLAVLFTSLFSPDLVFGTEEEHVKLAAIANWFWGVLGTVFVLRSTVFLRPSEIGWGQSDAWPWIAVAVAGLWLAATVVSIGVPTLEIGTDIQVPVAAAVASPIAAMLTWYACRFLVEGFAARNETA